MEYLRDEKNGITWEMIKAQLHRANNMLDQLAHPTRVWSLICRVSRKSRKKMKRAVTEAYKHPRKRMVGRRNEKDIFLYSSCRELNAGDFTY